MNNPLTRRILATFLLTALAITPVGVPLFSGVYLPVPTVYAAESSSDNSGSDPFLSDPASNPYADPNNDPFASDPEANPFPAEKSFFAAVSEAISKAATAVTNAVSNFFSSFHVGAADVVAGAITTIACGACSIVAGPALAKAWTSVGGPNPGFTGAIGPNGASMSWNSNGPAGGAVGAALGAVGDALGVGDAFKGVGDAFKGAAEDFTNAVSGGASPDAGPDGGNDTGIDAPQVLSQQIVVPSQSESGGLACTNPDYPQLCGITSCIPGGATCCSSVGFADRYCPSGSFCTIEGQCESTSGGQNCSASYNQACQSAANSCGMKNNGFNSCTGSCQAVTPADSSCATPGITLTQTPAFVNPGEVCQIVWATTNTTACALVNVNTGATVSSGLNKTYLTPPISAQTDFRLNCKNGTVVSAEASISCRINPGFEEE